jgi:hypothetical protein
LLLRRFLSATLRMIAESLFRSLHLVAATTAPYAMNPQP